jgi:hypothetical protein
LAATDAARGPQVLSAPDLGMLASSGLVCSRAVAPIALALVGGGDGAVLWNLAAALDVDPDAIRPVERLDDPRWQWTGRKAGGPRLELHTRVALRGPQAPLPAFPLQTLHKIAAPWADLSALWSDALRVKGVSHRAMVTALGSPETKVRLRVDGAGAVEFASPAIAVLHEWYAVGVEWLHAAHPGFAASVTLEIV